MNLERLGKRLILTAGAIASAVTSLSFFAGADGLTGIALVTWYFFAALSAILTLVLVLIAVEV